MTRPSTSNARSPSCWLKLSCSRSSIRAQAGASVPCSPATASMKPSIDTFIQYTARPMAPHHEALARFSVLDLLPHRGGNLRQLAVDDGPGRLAQRRQVLFGKL